MDTTSSDKFPGLERSGWVFLQPSWHFVAINKGWGTVPLLAKLDADQPVIVGLNGFAGGSDVPTRQFDCSRGSAAYSNDLDIFIGTQLGQDATRLRAHATSIPVPEMFL